MLSENPQDRGSAGELASALEAAATAAGPEADKLTRPSLSRESAAVRSPPASEPRGGGLGPLVLMPLAAWLIILLAGNVNLSEFTGSLSTLEDGGSAGVADAAVEAFPVAGGVPEPEPSELALEMPKGPLPGQRRPPCPRFQINIQGGCWLEVTQASPPCGESYYDWKGACYSPVAAPPRPSTSGKNR
jgi:eukaryotic-like serine/threonine-protein kinase